MLVILKRLRLHHQIGLKGKSGVGLSLDVFLNVADKVGTGWVNLARRNVLRRLINRPWALVGRFLRHCLHMAQESLMVLFIVYVIHHENVSPKRIVLAKLHNTFKPPCLVAWRKRLPIVRINTCWFVILFFKLRHKMFNLMRSLLNRNLVLILTCQDHRQTGMRALTAAIRHAWFWNKLNLLLFFFNGFFFGADGLWLPVGSFITDLLLFLEELAASSF